MFPYIFAHVALGALLALFFALYYVNGDGKWKLFLEFMIGIGGNVGGMFVLYQFFPTNIDETEEIEKIGEIKALSIASCILSFLIFVIIFLLIASLLIKDEQSNNFIGIRDIILGKRSLIDAYYKSKQEEINTKLNLPLLQEREREIQEKEESLESWEVHLVTEQEKINQLTKKKLKLQLPENGSVVLTNEYIEIIPSYISNVIYCVNNIVSCTKEISEKSVSEIDQTTLRSYFGLLATYISNDIFGGNSNDVRIHFRIYDQKEDGYVKLVAVAGGNIVRKKMSVIPLNSNNMIKKSYECRRALIKSLNEGHNFQSNNHVVWKDYMTYTFYDIEYNEIPFLSFGISIKNIIRYTKMLHLLNFFKFEDFLQSNIEKVNDHVNMGNIFYGGTSDDSNK